MKNWLLTLIRDEEAATAVEYAVILALILVAVISAVASFGTETGCQLTEFFFPTRAER